MTIRDLEAADLAAVCEIIERHSNWDAKYARQAIERELAERQMGLPRGKHIVAETEDGIVGVSGWREDEFGSEGIFWLGWTCVHPDHRLRGIGTALLHRVIEDISARGARKLYLDTGATGYEAALAFYRAHGFVDEARLPDYYSDGEDALVLARRV